MVDIFPVNIIVMSEGGPQVGRIWFSKKNIFVTPIYFLKSNYIGNGLYWL